MEELKKKLDEIVDFDIKEIDTIWDEADIKTLEEKHNLKLPQDYVFYLKHYGNDYIREDFRFIPSIELPKKIKQTQFEIDSIYGLNNDENRLDDKINTHWDILPYGLFPIADLPGGDLICMGKQGDKHNKIYIWFHEMDVYNVVQVCDSFERFIENFKRVKVENNTLDNVKLSLGDKLNDFLNNASKNMK
ncbi:SMI1/KNR4 family protein [Rummeliibacillus pycnus]|uniref:SMI1/KNR4 family protein n=1 Tax=Rummeliibacillus pycnus TaxID=101070 RepID=UPI003D28E2E4